MLSRKHKHQVDQVKDRAAVMIVCFLIAKIVSALSWLFLTVGLLLRIRFVFQLSPLKPLSGILHFPDSMRCFNLLTFIEGFCGCRFLQPWTTWHHKRAYLHTCLVAQLNGATWPYNSTPAGRFSLFNPNATRSENTHTHTHTHTYTPIDQWLLSTRAHKAC